MNSQERTMARQSFKLKIHEANGQAYEDLFVRIMAYADPGFKAIKAQGSIGDRKNDGYNKTSGQYYQVFAPEDINKSHASAASKLKSDFCGLISQWPNVREFYFVINDKFRGAYPTAEQDIEALPNLHPGLEKADIFLAKDLENLLFTLDEDQILDIVGFLPSTDGLAHLDYSIVNEVVRHIMNLPLSMPTASKLIAPDWQKKITFNSLSPATKSLLDAAFLCVNDLDTLLHNNSDYLAQGLRDHLNELFHKAQSLLINNSHEEFPGDLLFWHILKHAAARNERAYQDAVLVFMAKYFESCDIFEEPQEALLC